MEIYRYAQRLFKQAEIPEGQEAELTCFHKKIDSLFPLDIPAEQRKICIFCVGNYGEELHRRLRERLILVDFFCDNNPKKWGYVMDGISCIPPEALLKYRENILVMVANKTPDAIVSDLQEKGYRNIITKQELDSAIEQTLPVKWIVQWQEMQKMDYAIPEAECLIHAFSRTVFEICMYYRSQLMQQQEPK